MTKISENKTRLLVTSELKFLKKPNFLAKGESLKVFNEFILKNIY